MKILVTGATGKTGGELVKLLLADNQHVRAAARDVSKAKGFFPGNAEVVPFDFEQPGTFAPALKGMDKVFLIARPGDNHSDKAAAPLIDAAKKEGIRHIVNLTAMGVEADENFMLRRLERYLEDSGIPYTHLRPNWFMQNFNEGPMYADIKRTGALHLPAADAKVSFIDVTDIAEVSFVTLAKSGHEGKAYTLTGPETLNYHQVIEKISAAAGKTLSYVPLTEEMAAALLAKTGVPKPLIDRWTDFYRKIRTGLCEPVSAAVEHLLGRPAGGFDVYAMKHAQFWR